MDPNATIELLADACKRDVPDEIAQHADDLYRWLENGGFMPTVTQDQLMSMLAILANEEDNRAV